MTYKKAIFGVLGIAACAYAVLPAHALTLTGTNLNGNTNVQPPLDLTVGLEGQLVFDTLNPIQLVFQTGAGDAGGVGFQFIVENESALAWGDFHVTVSNGAFFSKVGDIRPFNPAPADSDVDPAVNPTTVNIFFLPKLPCGGQLNPCAAANDFENSVALGDMLFAGDTGVNDAADWIINVDNVQPGAAGTFFSLTLTPSLEGRTPVPEPASLPLVGAGLAALGWLAARRSKRRQS